MYCTLCYFLVRLPKYYYTNSVNWTSVRRSENISEIFWMSTVSSVYALCPWGKTCPLWSSGEVVIIIEQFQSTKPEPRFWAGSNPVRGVLEIRDGEDVWQWSWLEIKLNAFCVSTISQKQFIIHHHYHHRHHHHIRVFLGLFFFFFSMNIIYTIRKWIILRKINYIQRNLDVKRSARH